MEDQTWNKLANTTRGTSIRLTALPRNTKLIVDILAIEELPTDFGQSLLHLGIQNDIIPAALLNRLPELGTLGPVAIVDVDGRLLFGEPGSNGAQKGIGDSRVAECGFIADRASEHVLDLTVADGHVVEDEVIRVPLVVVLCKEDGIREISRST